MTQRKNTRRKILGALFVLAMAAGTFMGVVPGTGITAKADSTAAINLGDGSSNMGNLDSDHYHYDAATHTITLKKYSFSGWIYSSGIYYEGSVELTIILEGKNSIIHEHDATKDTEDPDGPVCIFSEKGIIIKGDGSLNAKGGASGIYTSKNITIKSGTVTASGTENGISGTVVTISGGKVSAKADCGDEQGAGIEADKIEITGGEVEAKKGDNGYGLEAYGIDNVAITISGGKVVSDNIYTRADITISGGTVIAAGGIDTARKGKFNSYTNSITISGGEVETANSISFYNITISGGKVTVISPGNVGILADEMLTINGGTVSTICSGGPGVSASKITINDGTLTAGGKDKAITGEILAGNGKYLNVREGNDKKAAEAAKADNSYDGGKYAIITLGDKIDDASTAVPKATGTKVTNAVDSSDKGTYKVTNSKVQAPTVEYTGTKNTSATTITIPDTIKDDKGVTYSVTKIADNAFKNNKKIKNVKGGKNITEIGKNSFKGAAKLTTADFSKSQITKVGANAFDGSKKLKTIKLNGNKLKSVGKNAFKSVKKKAKITVYAKNKKTYKNVVKKIKKGGAKTAKYTYKNKN